MHGPTSRTEQNLPAEPGGAVSDLPVLSFSSEMTDTRLRKRLLMLGAQRTWALRGQSGFSPLWGLKMPFAH